MLDYQLLSHSLIVAVVMFALGVVGFITRRNLVVVLVSSAIMLQGAMLALSAFSTFHAENSGQFFSVATISIAAFQAAIVLAMTRWFARTGVSPDVSRVRILAEAADSQKSSAAGGTLAGSDEAKGAGD